MRESATPKTAPSHSVPRPQLVSPATSPRPQLLVMASDEPRTAAPRPVPAPSTPPSPSSPLSPTSPTSTKTPILQAPTQQAPTASPALVIDDEHKRPTLEQRLDAAVLAAGATPPRGLRVGIRKSSASTPSMVPLRLQAPAALVDKGFDSVDNEDILDLSESRAPRPRMLQFLRDDERHSLMIDESVSRIPRLEPVFDSSKLPVAVGVHTNTYRLGGVETEETPSRPLPVLSLDADPETLLRLTRSQVMKKASLDGLDVSVSTFSCSRESLELTSEGGAVDDRGQRAPAAVALHALSDEGVGELGTIDDLIDVPSEDLDELAAQLGLTGLAVPRTTPPTRADDSLDGGALDDLELVTISADDVELVTRPGGLARPTGRRPVVETDAVDALEDLTSDKSLVPAARRDGQLLDAFGEDGDDDGDDDEPSFGTLRLPASLLPQGPVEVEEDEEDSLARDSWSKLAAAFDEDEVTPPHGTARPSLEAPSAVRFVVAEAPPRPRYAALSPEEIARNKLRARELYLIALDDIGHQDNEGAIVHLQLAVAYDDDTAVYSDLLKQLERKVQR